MDSRSVGVEEEFLLVEPETGCPTAVAGSHWRWQGRRAERTWKANLQQQQLETNSRPCKSPEELHRELRRCRTSAAMAAARAGAQVAALGTSPLPVEPEPLRTSRYERMAGEFGLTAHEQLTCGCHIHIRISSADEGVAVLLTELLMRGNGASFQRAAYRRSGDLTDVIRGAVAVTETGLCRPARRFCRVEALPDGYHECPYWR